MGSERNEPTVLEEKPQAEDGCFIATAYFGRADCDEVVTLRRFRDTTLRHRVFGRLLIRLYYNLSPFIATLLRESSIIRDLIGRLCISPALRLARSHNSDKPNKPDAGDGK